MCICFSVDLYGNCDVWSLITNSSSYKYKHIFHTNGATSMSFDTFLSFNVQYLPFNMSVTSTYGYMQLVLPQHEETP